MSRDESCAQTVKSQTQKHHSGFVIPDRFPALIPPTRPAPCPAGPLWAWCGWRFLSARGWTAASLPRSHRWTCRPGSRDISRRSLEMTERVGTTPPPLQYEPLKQSLKHQKIFSKKRKMNPQQKLETENSIYFSHSTLYICRHSASFCPLPHHTISLEPDVTTFRRAGGVNS